MITGRPRSLLLFQGPIPMSQQNIYTNQGYIYIYIYIYPVESNMEKTLIRRGFKNPRNKNKNKNQVKNEYVNICKQILKESFQNLNFKNEYIII
jgi:hypothetical protein